MMNVKDVIVYGILELAAQRDAALAEAADLRRQLAECRQIAAARGEELGYAEADADWPEAQDGDR